MKFKHDLGSTMRDKITGFEGVVVARTQWLHNCNTYGLQPTKLKDGMPGKSVYFDEPQLEEVPAVKHATSRKTGGPERRVSRTNR